MRFIKCIRDTLHRAVISRLYLFGWFRKDCKVMYYRRMYDGYLTPFEKAMAEFHDVRVQGTYRHFVREAIENSKRLNSACWDNAKIRSTSIKYYHPKAVSPKEETSSPKS